MKFPKLPKNQKPTYYYRDKDFFVAIVVGEDVIREYIWDGYSKTYNKFVIYDKIDLEMNSV